MIKSAVVSEVARRTGISKSDVQRTIEVLMQVIKDAMVEQGAVHFRGFGSFLTKRRARKVARNIAQNTALIIGAHYVPTFRPAKAFVQLIKQSVQDT